MNNKRACRRKRQYLKGQAYSIAEKRNLHTGRNGTAYPCAHCGFWHVTKQSKPWPLKKEKS